MSDQTQDAPAVRAHATVWAISRSHKQAAFASLIGADWSGADRFDLCGVVATNLGLPCPLNLTHPAALASQSDTGWAWVLHDPAMPPPLVEVTREHDDGCACLQGGRAAQALHREAER